MDCEKFCKNCKPATHCCIFPEDTGFTFVSPADAIAIKEKTNKEFADFLDFSPLPAQTIELLKDGDPALEGYLRYSLLDEQGRILRLQTKNKRCIFLKDDNACGIYGVRPSICKIYPLWGMRLTDKSIKVIGHDPEPRCPAMEANDGDIEEVLSQEEIATNIALFKRIEQEANDYAVQLKKVVRADGSFL